MSVLATEDQTAIAIIGRHLDSAPVNVHAIVRDLGLSLLIDPEMGSDLSGKIERHGAAPGGYRISVNGRHSRTRQRFTIAHEIAHFVLHRDLIGAGITDDAFYRSNRGDHVERLANSYAAAILMPAPLVRRKFQEGLQSSDRMAEAFDVSRIFAQSRMNDLRLK